MRWFVRSWTDLKTNFSFSWRECHFKNNGFSKFYFDVRRFRFRRPRCRRRCPTVRIQYYEHLARASMPHMYQIIIGDSTFYHFTHSNTKTIHFDRKTKFVSEFFITWRQNIRLSIFIHALSMTQNRISLYMPWSLTLLTISSMLRIL